MKKNTLFITILFIAVVGMTSCKKGPISDMDQDFVGSWYSEYNDLYIGEDGYGSFNRQKGALTSYINGRVRITDKKVIFSAGVVSNGLRIDTRPYETTDGWEMVLKDEIYYSY